MCGITFIHSPYGFDFDVYDRGNMLKHRGPDESKFITDKGVYLGFNRLVINDDSIEALQPFQMNGISLICNGEIFNWELLVDKYNLHLNTSCDCEVIIQLFVKLHNENSNNYEYIMKKLCNELDGEFAFVLYIHELDISLSARDPYGVRPLFCGKNRDSYGFSSEMKSLDDIFENIEQFYPGCYSINGFSYTKYTEVDDIKFNDDIPEEYFIQQINEIFKESVRKRLMSDKEICCLLSGGLDSSLVAGLVSKHFEPYTLKTFTIGLKGSTDIEYAKEVAKHIKSDHTTIELENEDFLDAIEEVIKTIESYDTTTVRASVGNYLVAKYIKSNTNCKVVFNGDYSDEVLGGYKYLSKCHNEYEFHNECVRLVDNIHFFDSLRSDRCISSQGLEARVPFADKEFVQFYFSIPIKMRMCNTRIEKYLIRKAFEGENILPENVLWRRKEAFSDGVSSTENSWHIILKQHVEKKFTNDEYDEMLKQSQFNKPILKETAYYKSIYKKYYKSDRIIPYYWLPKYCDGLTDPSAREIV